MKELLLGVGLLLALSITACSSSDNGEILEVEVGPRWVDCQGGLIPGRQCLLVDGETFYERIKGFD